MTDNNDTRVVLKNALVQMRQMRQKIEALEQAKKEPIAVIGLGCRFPGGANSPAQFWKNLQDGRDAMTPIPPSRWDGDAFYDADADAPGKSYVREAGFIDQVEGFEPQFFGISPREAAGMDPQQRLLMEVTWEALEHAALMPERLKGSKTAVYIGQTSDDYAQRTVHAPYHHHINPYTSLGNHRSIMAGRLSYWLGLHGTALQLDTACSSSLLAIHLAVQSLRQGESDLALAGGVNLMLSPNMMITLSKLKALSPDGRCRTFDAAANGYARGEGCGVIVLKRLSDAERDGDHVLAVVRGTAVNHDGASNGLTAPSGQAQIALLEQAVKDAGIRPEDVQYIEAHGTGTPLGDPIEVQALGKVLGERSTPLMLGTVKTNIGHLEAAAGVAGVIKAVLALYHEQIPPSLHFETPNPHIPWEKYPLEVVTGLKDWDAGENGRFAGVSSFGMSGTNVHVILGRDEGEGDEGEGMRDEASNMRVSNMRGEEYAIRNMQYLLPLSARSKQALDQAAGKYAAFLAASELSLGDVVYTAANYRTQFGERAVVMGRDAAELRGRLEGFDAQVQRGETGVVLGSAGAHERPRVAARIAFLFTGQGSQFVGMGQALYERFPVFREALERCAGVLDGMDLLGVLGYGEKDSDRGRFANRDGDRGRFIHGGLVSGKRDQSAIQNPKSKIDQTEFTQPALFALEYALAKLWESWGVVPDVVLGHSVGEIVAACVAGVMSLEDGLKLIGERGRLMGGLPEGGKMVVVMAGVGVVREVIGGVGDVVGGFDTNNKEHEGGGTVLDTDTGEHGWGEDRGRFANRDSDKGLTTEDVNQSEIQNLKSKIVDIAAVNGPESVVISGDGVAVDGVVARLEGMGVRCRPLVVSHAFHSGLMEPILGEFREVAETITYERPQILLISNVTGEVIEPVDADYWTEHIRRPVLFAQGIGQAADCDFFVEIGPRPTLTALGQQSVDGGIWLPSMRPRDGDQTQAILTALAELWVRGVEVDWSAVYPEGRKVHLPTYPFERQRYWIEPLGSEQWAVNSEQWREIELAGRDERRFEGVLAADAPRYLGEHVVFGEVIVPAAAFVEMVGNAAENRFPLAIEGLTMGQAFVVAEGERRKYQFVVQGNGWFQLFGQTGQGKWVAYASGQSRPLSGSVTHTAGELELLQATVAEPVDIGQFYAAYQRRGIAFGPSFRAITGLWQTQNEALAHIQSPISNLKSKIPPTLLDACVQTIAAALPESEEPTIQIGIERLHLYRPLGDELWSYAQVVQVERGTIQANVRVYGSDGKLSAAAEGVLLKQTNQAALLGASQSAPADWFYKTTWEPVEAAEPLVPADFLPSPTRMRDDVEIVWPTDWGAYETAVQQLNRLSVRYAFEAFRKLGCVWGVGERFTAAEVRAQCGILPKYTRLVQRLLGILAEGNVLRPVGEAWEVQSFSETAVAIEPNRLTAAEFTLLKRCAEALPGVLLGEIDPIQVLFPGGDLNDAAHLYRDSLAAQVMNGVVLDVFKQIVRHLPEQRPLRIIEVGAGTGGTTSILLPHLPKGQTRYLFTDVGDLLTEQAQQSFSAYEFLEYHLLDIEKPFDEQVQPGQFDVVLAANVLHATRDLGHTLQNARQLLAPNGVLVMLEGTRPQAWLDMIFGLTEGWWRFEDVDVRPDYPLLAPDAWGELFREAGFAAADFVEPAEWLGQAVLVAQAAPVTAASWLIVEEESSSVGLALAEALVSKGHTAEVILDFELVDMGQLPAWPSPLHVVHLAGLSVGLDGMRSALPLAQKLIANEITPESFWLVSQGAQMESTAPHQAALWGFGRVLAQEHPELGVRLFDVDPAGEGVVAALLPSLLVQSGEEGLVEREGRLFVPRLGRARVESKEYRVESREGVYLITGGLGSLGLLTAEWLVEKGVDEIWLVGRSAPRAEVAETLTAWRAQGVVVETRQVDVARGGQVEGLIDEIKRGDKPLRGVVHTAGQYDDSLIREMTWEQVQTVFGAKVMGAWHLHEATAGLDLDLFVLYSSASAVLGGVGLANYVAANSFLDGLARHRQGLGLAGMSINWGPWADTGMAESVGAQREQQWLSWGIRPMGVVQALDGLDKILAGRGGVRVGSERGEQLGSPVLGQVGVMDVDWVQYGRQAPVIPSLLGGLMEEQGQARGSAGMENDILIELKRLPERERPSRLEGHVRETVARILGFGEAAALDVRQGFFELGMDSLMATELRNRLQIDLDCVLSPTLTFKYPNIVDLTGFLTQTLWGGEDTAVDDEAEAAAVNDELREEIAGMDDEALLQLLDDELADLLGGD